MLLDDASGSDIPEKLARAVSAEFSDGYLKGLGAARETLAPTIKRFGYNSTLKLGAFDDHVFDQLTDGPNAIRLLAGRYGHYVVIDNVDDHFIVGRDP